MRSLILAQNGTGFRRGQSWNYVALSMQTNNSSLTLDELIAFNGELAAVVHAGVPIDLGLAGEPSNWKSRLARLTERLAVQVQQGHSLPQALALEKSVPPMYRAVVEAGVRAGRLPEALEGLSRFVLLLRNMRQQLLLTLLPPAVVVCLGYLVWLTFLTYFIPEVISTYISIRKPPGVVLEFLAGASRTLWSWCWIPPLLVVCTAFVLRQRNANSSYESKTGNRLQTSFGFGWAGSLALLPGIGRLIRISELASFSELTGLLVAQQTPLPEALELAAGVLGDPSLHRGVDRFTEKLRQGGSLETESSGELPPYLRWLIQTGLIQGRLSQTLAEGADYYRRKADSLARWLQVIYPGVTVTVVCGSLVLFYCLTIFLPFRNLLLELAVP